MTQRDAEQSTRKNLILTHTRNFTMASSSLFTYVNGGGGGIYIARPPYSCLSRIKVLPVLETPPQSRQFLRFDGANRPDRSHKGDRSTSGNCSGKIVHRNDTIKLSTCVQRTTKRNGQTSLGSLLCCAPAETHDRYFVPFLLRSVHSDDVTICRCIFMNNAFHAIRRVFSIVFVRFFSSSKDDGFQLCELKKI